MRKIRVFSTFSGVGGLEREILQTYDCELVGYCEVVHSIAKTFENTHPGVKNYGDITRIDTGKLPDFDLLTGGSPCQSFSVAGTKSGLEGESGLLRHYLRIAGDKKPEMLVWENVVNAKACTGGWDFLFLQSELAELGYDVRWEVLSATDFGVPQSRDRIFLVGHRVG